MSAVNPNSMEKSMVSVLVVANAGGQGDCYYCVLLYCCCMKLKTVMLCSSTMPLKGKRGTSQRDNTVLIMLTDQVACFVLQDVMIYLLLVFIFSVMGAVYAVLSHYVLTNQVLTLFPRHS